MIALAWRNLASDRLRCVVAIVGLSFSVFLMAFQGSLLIGFTKAASRLIDATGADIWIMARGVPCFDYAAPLPERFRDLSLGVAGVERAHRVIAGLANWHPSSGRAKTVMVVGADIGLRGTLPRPRRSRSDRTYENVLIDATSVAALEATALPAAVEIGTSRRRAVADNVVEGFSTFLGSPYVFADYTDGRRYLGWREQWTTFIAVDVEHDADVSAVQRELTRRLPDVDIRTTPTFARQSATYWLVQTGAGGALLTAAALGFLFGVVVVAQNMYAITVERLGEFATLRAIGASKRHLVGVVMLQAVTLGVIGVALGLSLVVPGVALATVVIPWVYAPPILLFVVATLGIVMCLLASLVALRPVLQIDPATVFRT
jgi:putative ABC transport system permease protein